MAAARSLARKFSLTAAGSSHEPQSSGLALCDFRGWCGQRRHCRRSAALYLDFNLAESRQSVEVSYGARWTENGALEFTTPLQSAQVKSTPSLDGLSAMSVGSWFFVRRGGAPPSSGSSVGLESDELKGGHTVLTPLPVCPPFSSLMCTYVEQRLSRHATVGRSAIAGYAHSGTVNASKLRPRRQMPGGPVQFALRRPYARASQWGR